MALPSAVTTSLWVLLSLTIVALAWIVVVKARRAGEELTALLAVAVAELLVSPISWGHHWVWIAPALLLLTSPAWRRRKLLLAVGLPVLAVFAIGPPWLLPSDNNLELHWTWWQHLIGDSYVLIGVLFLVLAAFLTPRWPASGKPVSCLTSAVRARCVEQQSEPKMVLQGLEEPELEKMGSTAMDVDGGGVVWPGCPVGWGARA